METVQIKPKRRKFSKLLIVFTILIELVLTGVIGISIISRGPFNNIRNYLIGTAMTTLSHQYIAKMLFTTSQIDAVANKGNVQVEQQKISSSQAKLTYDESIKVEEITSQNGSFHGYLIDVANPLRVKLAYTKHLGTVGQLTSQMAIDHNAIAAINGGGFYTGSNATGTGELPTDFIFSGGQLAWKDQNISENDTNHQVVAIDGNGTLIVGNRSISQLKKLNVSEACTMPGYQPIVVNGKATYKDEGGKGFQPRTVIGQTTNKHILMLVLDGRKLTMKGATMLDIQKIMLDHGAVTAANLDGGASSAMFYNGELLNKPCGALGERTVATCFYVTQ